jgi:hypothetical protein
MTLPAYVVTFRGKPACPCLAEWLPVFEAELIRRGVVNESIDIAQLIGGAAASGGTHALGGAFDIWQHDDVTIWVARQMGADACWPRTTGAFVNVKHAHGVLRGCDHNGPARYQIAEVDAGGDGLIGNAPDPGPRPLSGRSWREGIAWAKELQEDDMANYAEQLTRIENQNDAILKRLAAQGAIRVRLAKLVEQGKADSKDLAALQRELETLTDG